MTIAGRGLCLFFFCISSVVATEGAVHAQATHDDLPPLPAASGRSHGKESVDAKRRRSSFDELQLLVPATPLLCWSHSPMENPQGSRDNAGGNEMAKDGVLRGDTAADPITDPIINPVPRPRRDP